MIIRANTTSLCQQPGPNTISVPRQPSFHVPTGFYRATIKSIRQKVRQSSNSSIPIILILFAVDVPGANVDYLAKLELKADLKEGSELWNLLSKLLGRKQLQAFSGKDLDLDILLNLPCDLQIEHIHSRAENYEFPLVIVADVQIAGRLVKTEERAENPNPTPSSL
jgi:hypothetical protein